MENRFDEYEIGPVVESETCEVFESLELAEAAAQQSGGNIFWTLYGRTRGIAEAISDESTEQDAIGLLYRLTGIQARVTGTRQIIRVPA